MSHLLHPEVFDNIPLTGHPIAAAIENRAEVIARTRREDDGAMTVAVRALNEATALKRLLTDISCQEFNGELEVVVVDNESVDGTPEVAQQFGARVITLPRDEFTYPRSMNVAVDAASHERVFLTVGHSQLSNDQVLRAGTLLLDKPHVGGAYAHFLPTATASRWERYLGTLFRLDLGPYVQKRPRMGTLGAVGMMLNKSVWNELGRFDERFERGGEDAALAKRMLAADYNILLDPVLSVHHSHGLNFVDMWKQAYSWVQADKPRPLDLEAIAARRPDRNFDR